MKRAARIALLPFGLALWAAVFVVLAVAGLVALAGPFARPRVRRAA